MAKFFKKAFTMSVVVTTVLWAVGLAAFVPTAQAVSSGDLIKASGAAVYYFGADGKRYVFPNEKTFKTWYSDFSSVVTITDAELAAIPIGGNVTYRPGVQLVKITTDPKVYAVDAHGALRWIETEAVAAALYGSNWASKVHDVPDAFFTNYTIGSSISAASQYDVAAVTSSASSINVDKGLASGQQGGAVTVSVASDTPAGATLPGNATGVKVLKIKVGGTGTLNELTIKSLGVGSASDIASAYLYEGNTRLTSGKSFNSSTKEITFSGSWSAPRTLTLVVDVATIGTATASNQHQFSVIKVNGNAISGVTGSTFTIGGQDVSNIQVSKGTTPSNPKVGTDQALIAEFKITGGANDAWVHAITLTQSGSINVDEIKSFTLKQGTTTIATATGITQGDKVVLTFSTPYSLLAGAVKNFSLYADVAGRPGRTVTTYLDETSDLMVTDALYGFGASVNNPAPGTPFNSANAATVTTEGGDVTIAFNGPATGDISKGAQDAVLWKGSISSASGVEVKNSYIRIQSGTGVFSGATSGTDYLTDIKIRNAETGATIAGPVSLPAGNGLNDVTLTFTDDFSVTGTVKIEVTADIFNGTEENANEFYTRPYTVTFGHNANGYIFNGGVDVKYQGSNDYVAGADIVPNVPIAGNQQTVRVSSLTVTQSTYVGDSTLVKGAKDQQAVAFALTAGSDSAIKITKLVSTVGLADDGSTTYNDDAKTVVSSAKLWQVTANGLTLLDGPRGVNGTAPTQTVTFENFTLNVAAGDSVLVVVTFDATTTGGTGDNDAVRFSIEAAADITAEDADNNTVSAGGVPANSAEAAGDTVATVTTVGTISITADTADTAYKSRLVQMGSSMQKVLRVKARGTNEAFNVQKVTLTVNTTPANVSTVKVTYPTDASGTVFESKTAALASGVALFDGINWYVTKDKDAYLTVEANINTDTNGALSGNNAFSVQAETQNADLLAGANTKAIGMSSGTVASTNAGGNNDSVGNAMYARKTVITITKHATSPSGTKTPGVDDWMIFTVTNGTGDTATITDMTFRLVTSDGTNATHDIVCNGGSVDGTQQVYDLDDLSTDLADVTGAGSATVNDIGAGCTGGAGTDTADHVITFGTPLQISAGASKSYKFRADLTGASATDDDTFRVDIFSDDTAGAGTDLQWSDGLTTNNGFKVEQLPVSGGNIVF